MYNSIALVGAPWRAGSKAVKLSSLIMASPKKQATSSSEKYKRNISCSESDDQDAPASSKRQNTTNDSWPKFIVLSSKDATRPLTKVSPFVIAKTIKGVTGGDVPKVTKLRSGNLLVECAKQQQAKNILTISSILEVPVSAEAHRSLNRSQGIIRDRDRNLADLSEQEICSELSSQGVSHVKRFTKKEDNKIIKLNTYLITFNSAAPPSHINLGLFRVSVDIFIPNPLRCFKCQRFGHGKATCNGKEKCVKCAEEGHSDFNCTKNPKCVNCSGDHFSSSKQCPTLQREKEIQKLKAEKNITYQEARRQVSISSDTAPSMSYAEAAKPSRTYGWQTMYTWPEGEIKPRTCNTNGWMFGADCFVDDIPKSNIKYARPWKVLCDNHPPPRKSTAGPNNDSMVDEDLFIIPRKSSWTGFGAPTKASNPQPPSISLSSKQSQSSSSRSSSAAQPGNRQQRPSQPGRRQSSSQQTSPLKMRRSKKAERDAIYMHNRFGSLGDDMESDMDLSETPVDRSQSHSPQRRRRRSLGRLSDPIQTPK